jgi:protein-L-isoaspartate(D-aspartate) O-methyltransferase
VRMTRPRRAARARGAIAAALLGLAAGAAGAGLLWAAADPFAAQRRAMVDEQIRPRGITQPAVLAAMAQVPRHLFVPPAEQARAYQDQPLPFAPGRRIYQPYVVALMTSLLDLGPGERVLEVGTGSGYHAAVLSRMAREVYSVEIDAGVAAQARRKLAALGYHNVNVFVGDGYQGWPAQAPFDAILLSAAPTHVPKPLLDQLAVGGKMVVAQGDFFQDLQVITKTKDGLEKRTVIPVRLSPMTGKVQDE